MWTYYAMGLDPRAFEATEACLVQSFYEDPEKYPKMFWPTNYSRLACQVAFTLFNAGLDFAPNAIIDGKNIEVYLQDRLLDALSYFYDRIAKETDLMNRTIIGVETLNELNRGLVGYEDITKLSDDMHLKVGNTPTPLESMILGMGKPCEVEVYEFGTIGPRKIGTKVVDPKGIRTWVSEDYDDTKYGWKRDPGWQLGRCIWAQHGVWDDATNEVLKPHYFKFAQDGTPLDETEFNTIYFTRYWNRFYTSMRKVDKQMFLFCQPPTMSVPPKLKGSPYMDDHIIYAPHYYDGLTMVQKHWSTWWNADVLGVLRGRYAAPPLAIKIGETAIRNCMRDQIIAMREEGRENIGITPCLMSETGMPFDLDDRLAYRTGDYTSQIKAWDALGNALEAAQIHHTLWVYSSQNSHQFGDYWNGEDFSISSKVHDNLNKNPPVELTSSSEVTLVGEPDLKTVDAAEPDTEQPVISDPKLFLSHANRADQAIARPFPLIVAGDLKRYAFEMVSGIFRLHIDANHCLGGGTIGTEVSLPSFSFPEDKFEVAVSSGHWKFDSAKRILNWWHDEGEQTMEITSLSLPVNAFEKGTWFPSPFGLASGLYNMFYGS